MTINAVVMMFVFCSFYSWNEQMSQLVLIYACQIL